MSIVTQSNPKLELAARLELAIVQAFGNEHSNRDPLIRSSKFADFQSDVALSLAKPLRQNPRAIAEAIVTALDVSDFSKTPEVSGPGYINFELLPSWLDKAVALQLQDSNLGVEQNTGERVVIDYSSPNVAKEMHVGHLRTTVVGDSLARVLEATGVEVIRQNHIGDWGTPFGMLIELLIKIGSDSEEAKLLQTDPNRFYQIARASFDEDTAFAQQARKRVVMLQAGDPATIELWRKLVDQSRIYFNSIYHQLEVKLTDENLAGESFYNDKLEAICDELIELGIAEYSDGALCVFFDEYPNRDGEPAALVIRKSDGGYGYAATDLAALRYRADELLADRILYVVGAPQALHLSMVKSIAIKAGWLKPEVEFTHVAIGNVLGEDGKMLKTRSGVPVRLQMLLDEAVTAAAGVLVEKENTLAPEAQAELARIIGIGAVKYADLSVAHETEYTFKLERMLALTGNTGPYLQYAATRVRSVLRKATVTQAEALLGEVTITAAEEKTLALKLLDFGPLVSSVAKTSAIHQLCSYLYELAQAFSSFYETCPIMKAEPAEKETRLALAASTLSVLETGLGLLGIVTPEEM